MLDIFKKEKPEKVALNLQNPINQRIAIRASLNHKIKMVYKGDGIFLLELKRAKDEKIVDFFNQLTSESVDHIHGAIFRDDPKCDYVVIYDKKSKED